MRARKRKPGPPAMIDAADTITVYLRSTHSVPAERQAVDALGHVFRRVVVVASDSLNRNTCPTEGYVWAADGPVGVPEVARNLPYYGALIAEDA
ncbi:MAG: hypothetical protein Q8R82_08645 [Hyphomonadaceae bacterium]|nr:hypothetical protein [Hyphomonadaceae bacterium]